VNNGKQMNNSKAPTFVDVEINEVLISVYGYIFKIVIENIFYSF
jgi:hypothetical protein